MSVFGTKTTPSWPLCRHCGTGSRSSKCLLFTRPFRGVLNASFSASRELFPLRRILSGPLGLYKTSDLMSVLGPWILQSFLGKETTFGDDRHLTNRILSLGHWTGYLHLAKCESDTPAGFVRWVKQQTRWSKSFFREALVPEEFCVCPVLAHRRDDQTVHVSRLPS